MELYPNFKLFFDNNVLISIFKELKNQDVNFYSEFNFFVRNNIFNVCYTSFSLVELAQANDINEIFGMYAFFTELERIHFYDHEKKEFKVSTKEEFLQKALYKFFEFGDRTSIKILESKLCATEDGKRIFNKYLKIRNDEINDLDKILKGDLISEVQGTMGIKKGQYNHKSLEVVKEIFENKYLEFYDSVKHGPSAKNLPANIFSRDWLINELDLTLDESDFILFHLMLIEMFGYKQKKISKVRMFNSLLDNYYVSISQYFDYIITDDKNLKLKILDFQTNCKVLSYNEFKKIIHDLMLRLREIRGPEYL